MIYTVVDLSQLHKPTAMYDIACIAIKKNDYDLFLWSLTSKYHLDINVNDHILMKYCVNHNMGKFVEAVLYYYSVYYKAYITENGSIAIDSLNPFIECIKQKFYKRGIYIMQLIKSTDKKVIDCGICMKAAGDEDEDESAPFVVTTACQHSFCLSCFVNWQENPISQRRCALCRRYVKYDETTCYHNA
jgi:hypothetical protein